jgi:alpha-D-ribose 1-methylphosphonate 5-triphosphate synthase subunit PhnH
MTAIEPVVNSPQLTQQRFRALLQALSCPGCPVTLPAGDAGRAPLTLVRYPLVVAETLLDHEVTFAVIGNGLLAGDAQMFAREVQLRTGAQPGAHAEADFVFIFGQAGATLYELPTGDLAFPDQGATLVWSVDGFVPSDGGGVSAGLSGPGIPGEVQLFVGGVAPEDLAALTEINRGYPCGLDALFVDTAGTVVGLPRSSLMSNMGFSTSRNGSVAPER